MSLPMPHRTKIRTMRQPLNFLLLILVPTLFLSAVALTPAAAHMRHGVTPVSASPLLPSPSHQYTVPYIDRPPTIDAKPNDWSEESMDLNGDDLAGGIWDGSQDLHGSLRLAWDDSYLYFYLHVVDDRPSAPFDKDTQNSDWQIIASRMLDASTLQEDAWDLAFTGKRLFFFHSGGHRHVEYCCLYSKKWQMLPLSVAGTQGQIYANGQAVHTFEATPFEAQDDLPVCIGCNDFNTLPPAHFFAGAIDELRIYDRALDAAEVKALHQNGR
jgi:hypothetical protein